jgi:tight adherence protein B
MLDAQTMQLVGVALASLAFAAVVVTLAWPYISGAKQTEKRIATVTESRANKVATRSAAETAAHRRKAVTETLKDIENKKQQQRISLRLRLQQAGWALTPKTFWIICAGFAAAAAVTTMLSFPPTPTTQLGAVVAAFIVGLGLPRWLLNRATKRRQAKFLRELANSIDVIVRGVKSGLPLNECLRIISTEGPEPVAGEFRDVVEQQRVGVSLGEALERMVERMPLPEVKFLAIVISIQQQAGGNLSEALGNLAGVLRDRFRMQMKVKGLSAEATTSAMVLGSLPPIVMGMVSMASPDYIAPLFSTKTGNMFLLAGGFWMLLGILMMRKMINFKY